MNDPGRVLVVGCASRDVTVDDRRGWRLGGAVAFGGLTLARLGLRPRLLMGVDEPAANASELDALRAAGAEVRLVPLRRTPVFRNVEAPAGRSQVCLEPGDALPVTALPDGWGAATAWMLGPVADELPADWARVIPDTAFVSLGWQGLLRDLPRGGPVTRRPPAPHGLLERASVAAVSLEDVEPGMAPDRLWSLLAPDATLVVTDGVRGGSEYRRSLDGRTTARRWAAVPAASDVDATGAGDAFLAAYVAARLGALEGVAPGTDALRVAAAAGSLTVEQAGLAGVPTLASVLRRANLPPAVAAGGG